MIPSSDSLLLVDGKVLAYRAAHNFKDLTDESGNDISLEYGYLDAILWVKRLTNSQSVCVVWDGEPKFRRSLYADYKANRSGSREMTERIEKSPLKSLLTDFGFSQAWSPEEEADDVIATLAKSHPGRVWIYSTDRDFCPLVDDKRVVLISPGRPHTGEEKVWDTDSVEECFGLLPQHLVFYKTFFGDKSDNIKGLHRFKKAKLIPTLKMASSVEDVFDSVDLGTFTPNEKEKFVNFREQARLNFQLTSLRESLTNIEKLPGQLDREKVAEHCGRLRFSDANEVLRTVTPGKGFIKTG